MRSVGILKVYVPVSVELCVPALTFEPMAQPAPSTVAKAGADGFTQFVPITTHWPAE